MAIDRGTLVGAATLCAAGLHLVLSIILVPLLAERGVALAGCIAYGVLAVYLGARARLFRWIDLSELRPFRLIVFAALSGLGWYAASVLLEGKPVRTLVAGGGVSLTALFALGLIRMSDLHHFMKSMPVPAEPEAPPHQEPFARD